MSEQQTLARLNSHLPKFIHMLGGEIVAVDSQARSCTFSFNIGRDFCHSVDVVQGGFVTAMLDAAMSHAVFAMQDDDSLVNLLSLEIKTSYLETTRAGSLRAEGTIIKAGYKLAFLEGRLFDAQGVLTATCSSVAKLIRAKP